MLNLKNKLISALLTMRSHSITINQDFIIKDTDNTVNKLRLEKATQEWEQDSLKNKVDTRGVHQQDKPFYLNLPKHKKR